MLKPNDLPLICLPTELSDKAAATLIEFLQEFTAALEQHYCAQLRRHYNRNSHTKPEIDLDSPHFNPSEQPPF
jgi:hypothetical protein